MGLFGKKSQAASEDSALLKRGEASLSYKSFSMTVGQLEHALLKEFPAEDALDWDRTGLLVGNRAVSLRRVAVALDVTQASIAEAAARGAQVLVTHHPAYLSAPDSFEPEVSAALCSGANVWAAINQGVALMNFHTALDVSPKAATVLPQMLNLKFTGKFVEPLASSQEKGFGQVCEIAESEEETLEHLAARCLAVFGRVPRVWGNPDTRISSVVTTTGSANSLATEALKHGADVLICGELKYHEALDVSQAGMAVIELGHDVSELPLVAVLADAIVRVGVPAEALVVVNQSHNWWTPEATRV
jgi:dinuclear metal center YbgI/SA1388 family protein